MPITRVTRPPFSSDDFTSVLDKSPAWKGWFIRSFPIIQKDWVAFSGAVTANRGAYAPANSYAVGAVYSQAEVTALANAIVAANARIRALEEALR